MTKLDQVNAKLKKIIYDNISYTSQDYESIVKELVELLPKLSPNWNNISEADIVFILLSLMAAHKDILNYMVDYRVLEGYMSTAKEASSISRIANSFGYKVPAYKAAKVSAKFSIVTETEDIEEGDTFNLLSFSQFTDLSGISFAYIDEKIENIEEEQEIILYQGVINSISINFSNVDSTSKTLIIPNNNVAIGNNFDNKGLSRLVVSKDNESPIVFKEVENIYTANEDSDFIYEINVDTQGIYFIKFLNNLNTDQFIDFDTELTYLLTQGNSIVAAGPFFSTSLQKNDSTTFVNASFNLVADSFVLGSIPATKEEVREDFKRYYAGINSLVTLDDYKNFVLFRQKVVQGITKCLIIDENSSTLEGLFGSEDFETTELGIYVLKQNNEELSEDELEDLLNEIKKFKITGIVIDINGSEEIGKELEEIEISLEFNKLPTVGQDLDGFKAMILNYINNKQIGESLSSTEIYNLILNSKYAPIYFKDGLSIELSDETNEETSINQLNFNYNNYLTITGNNIVLAS